MELALFVHKTGPLPVNPKEYLILVFEWTGLYKEKPTNPSWRIRHWNGESWEKLRYFHDTGGYEWFECIAWAELPTTNL